MRQQLMIGGGRGQLWLSLPAAILRSILTCEEGFGLDGAGSLPAGRDDYLLQSLDIATYSQGKSYDIGVGMKRQAEQIQVVGT
jgi:hypothetical protein